MTTSHSQNTATPKLAILLSTYNGSRFVVEQLDSIINQTYQNFVIVIRDDGSSDDTVAILTNYHGRHPDKLHLVSEQVGNLGASGSFAWLVDYALRHKTVLGLESAYMMFCDQDDSWYEDKVATEMTAMLKAEQTANTDALPSPVLIHSDLQVVNADKQVLGESLIRYQGLEITRNRFPNLVISNLITGCTALINEPLARKALPVPDDAIMHDWWLGLVASAFGKVEFIDQPLVHYRQHGNNTIGAKEQIVEEVTDLSLWRRVLTPAVNTHLFEVATQARCFKQQFGNQLSLRQRLGLTFAACMRVRVGLLQRFFYRVARQF